MVERDNSQLPLRLCIPLLISVLQHAGSKNALEQPIIDPHYFEEDIGTYSTLSDKPVGN